MLVLQARQDHGQEPLKKSGISANPQALSAPLIELLDGLAGLSETIKAILSVEQTSLARSSQFHSFAHPVQ
jgi:hypothetical protein